VVTRWTAGWIAALVWIGGCADRVDSPEHADTTSGAGSSSASTTGTTADTGPEDDTSSTTTRADPDTTDASSSGSTGAIGEECPPAFDELGTVSHVNLAKTWTFEGESGISEGICGAIEYDGERLRLECLRVDGGPELHEMDMHGGGPVVDELLSAMVGMEELRLSLPYGMGFFPGYVVSHFTLRRSSGDLLVLASSNFGAGPGDPVANVGVDGWVAPFEDITLVDYGCAFRPNRSDTFPPAEQPFALEVGTDDGSISIFDGQQQTVLLDGVAYEVSVTEASIPSEVCMKCPEAQTTFSIVRHP